MTRMKKILRWLYIALGLFFIICLFYGVYLISVKVIKIFLSLPPEISATIIAATSTIIVAVLSIVIGKYYEQKRVIENELRQKKIPMYESFIEFYFKILMAEKIKAKKVTNQDMMKFFNTFTQELIVWGSDEMINLWSDYRRKHIDDGSDKQGSPLQTMYDFEELLLAIRKDTGHRNKNISKGSLLGLFINDLDKQEEQDKSD